MFHRPLLDVPDPFPSFCPMPPSTSQTSLPKARIRRSLCATPHGRFQFGRLVEHTLLTFSRQDHLREHVQRHHQLHKKKGARKVSGQRERSGFLCSKFQTWLLVFLWSRNGTDLEIQRVKTYCSICHRGVEQTRFSDDNIIYHQQTSCAQVFEHASNRDIKKKETKNVLQKRAGKQSHALEDGIGEQSTLSLFAVKKRILEWPAARCGQERLMRQKM